MVLSVVRMVPYNWCRSGVVAFEGSIAWNVFAFTKPLRMLKLVGSRQISLPDSPAVQTRPLHGVAAALEAVQGNVALTPANSTCKAGSEVDLGALHCDERCLFQ